MHSLVLRGCIKVNRVTVESKLALIILDGTASTINVCRYSADLHLNDLR